MSYITTLTEQQKQKKILDIYEKLKVMYPINNKIHIFLIKYVWNNHFKLDKLIKHINTYVNNNICIIIYGDSYYKMLEPIYYNEINKDIVEEYLTYMFKKISSYNNLIYDYNEICKVINSEMITTNNVFIEI